MIVHGSAKRNGSTERQTASPGIVLHDYWRSSASYRVRIALALKGIAYNRVSIDLVTGQQRDPAYLRLNPQGLVPALEVDDLILTQSLAIIEYLEETRPVPPLLPDSPDARAHIRALTLAIACEIHPVSNHGTLGRVEKLAGTAAQLEWNRDNIIRGLTAFEIMLNHPGHIGRFCYGDTPGLADCALIPQLYNATRWGVSFSHLPRIAAVAQNCKTHPAFLAAHPDNFIMPA
ncbi:maleylacetoacetate isomerase [Paracoccus onubensis]|uniref:maleylacetoacetate isomerase n=1 Tax=Paracoccus onubensis TaxID=1675788 RepID=UPI0027309426|nr:maleylacetoacetate isomerase [Paracoccus onubensis]MDP0930035.1 maleylacetoacetate isomerase [Paracoccus onubensis]